MKFVHWLAVILVIIGALNWGLIGVAGFNLVDHLVNFHVARIVYCLVGVSAIYLLINFKQLG